MNIIEPRESRVRLRQLTHDDADAAFVLGLLNDPSFVEHVGDRGVRTLDDTRAYLDKATRTAAAMPGLGSWLVERKSDAVPLGICTLIKREALEDVDLGYALAPGYRGAGYAGEACQAMLAYARIRMGLQRLVAIVSPGNKASIKLLGTLGFAFERHVRLEDDPDEICLYALALTQ